MLVLEILLHANLVVVQLQKCIWVDYNSGINSPVVQQPSENYSEDINGFFEAMHKGFQSVPL